MKIASVETKLRGSYYTPPTIARFLATWGIRAASDTVLEPSCGDGNIALEAVRRSRSLGARKSRLTAIELFPEEASKARARLRGCGLNDVKVECTDFFEAADGFLRSKARFDLVVGNPPFVRYQDFPEQQRSLAFRLMRELGFHPTRLANAWLPFLAISSALVAPKGRLAMVIPAELFQVGYAAELRQFLAAYFSRIDIITFSRLVFPDIQQEVVLLLADRAPTITRGIRVHEVADAEDLADLDLEHLRKQSLKPLDHASEKWTKYFLDASEIELLRRMRDRADIPLLSRYLDIDVGVVTGDNDFFLLDEERAQQYRLEHHSVNIVGRSAALQGLRFTSRDLAAWRNEGKATRLFLPARPFSAGVKRFVDEGKRRQVHTGYKCRIRKDWFVVPAVWIPDVFYLRQADIAPRLVVNKTTATCTDTLHRGRVLNGVPAEVLSVAFTNSLTWATSEVTGRSYGGGVMTYEPSEVERLPLPVVGASAIDLAEIDDLVRNKRLEDALDIVDRKVLIDGLGVSRTEVATLRGIWRKLRDRRRGRKLRQKTSSKNPSVAQAANKATGRT